MRVFLGLLLLLLLLALTTSSSAIYCLCKDGIGEKELQTAIDYACGSLADCNPIHDNGPCYQPNNIKSHCDWAVNSYFQKAAQVSGSCNFSGTATTNQNPPCTFFTLVSLAEEEYDDVGLLLNHQVTIPDGIAMASHFLLEPLSPPCSFEP
uniref:X8 domain-containing protein n=1 Tax=Brassica oleracea var. oleracea TaxID=109376 RepID=A0A0D3DPK3_BRAOL